MRSVASLSPKWGRGVAHEAPLGRVMQSPKLEPAMVGGINTCSGNAQHEYQDLLRMLLSQEEPKLLTLSPIPVGSPALSGSGNMV